ncbi:helix-turn-helix domain-containing protein [Actinacidiphila soli]|uniref:helix-turn-helix domain-containing protein n=1 Tax=Actinacidiphila soli TaxID=2487275 RepID=UPI000FCA5D3F|nr:pyridoxamine 5'-phosphate oxidase family protein [Actinacidiphila soli]
MTEQAKVTGDIGRRIALRRGELGLTREEVAARAGAAPGYLQYVEEQPAATPDVNFLLRLAEALGISLSQLHGGDADLPPGTGRAAVHPELVELGPEECWTHLSTHGVGRIAVSTSDGSPAIAPVNYTVVDRAIVFRTANGTTPALAAGTEPAFEVNHIDEALSQGWSVLVTGHADQVTDPDAVRQFAEAAHTEPWAGGEREMWVRIEPGRVTGRRILVH